MIIEKNDIKGVTLIELITSFLIVAIVAAATAGIIISLMEFFVYTPREMKARRAASDAMERIIEGENRMRGIRYASSIVDASPTQLTYIVGYPTTDEKNVVRITLDTDNSRLYRTYTGAGDTNPANLPTPDSWHIIPYYATGGASGSESDIAINYPSDVTGIFTCHYSGADINRVDVQLTATSGGSGASSEWRGQFTLRSGVEIRRD